MKLNELKMKMLFNILYCMKISRFRGRVQRKIAFAGNAQKIAKN